MIDQLTQNNSQRIAFIFAVFALLHAFGGFSPLLGSSDQAAAGAPILARIRTGLWLLIYLWCGIALIYNYGLSWLYWLIKYKPIICILVISAPLSFFWSMDPVITIERSVHLVGTCLLAVYIGYHLSLAKICDCLTIALSITITCGFFYSLLFPDLGRSAYDPLGGLDREVWVGLQGHKNGFASMAAVTILLFLALTLSGRYSNIRIILLPVCFIAFFSLYFAHSLTSTISLIAGLAIIIGYVVRRKFDLHITTIVFCALAVVLLGLVGLAGVGVDLFDQATWFKILGRSADFTGRIDIWSPTWDLITQNSFLGLGYGTVWFPRAGLEYQQQALLGLEWSAYHAHNGFLQIASQLGLPLALLSLWFVLSVTVSGFRLYFQEPSPIMLFAISFYMVFIIRNVFEATILIDRNFYWILFLIFSISTLRSYQALHWAKQ